MLKRINEAVYNSQQDLQDVWEWFEHNILDDMELVWDSRKQVYTNENTIEVKHIPNNITDIIDSYAKTEDADSIKWSANNGEYEASYDERNDSIIMTMKRNNGSMTFEFNIYESSIYQIEYIAPKTIFKADSL